MNPSISQLKPAERDYWLEYVAASEHRSALEDPFVNASYAGNRDITDELLPLYLSGKKSAGSSLVEDFVANGDPLPVVGNHWIYLNSRDEPKCILRTERIVINKFRDPL